MITDLNSWSFNNLGQADERSKVPNGVKSALVQREGRRTEQDSFSVGQGNLSKSPGVWLSGQGVAHRSC